MENSVPVYEVPAGHGRFEAFPDNGGGAIMYHCFAEDFAEPGSKMTPEHHAETHEQWVPVLGIKLTNSESARAWSSAFRTLAEKMEAMERSDTAGEGER